MQHLIEMCCYQCREKVEAIERRSFETPNEQHGLQAIEDRRELLMLLEASLAAVAASRAALKQSNAMLAEQLLERAKQVPESPAS